MTWQTWFHIPVTVEPHVWVHIQATGAPSRQAIRAIMEHFDVLMKYLPDDVTDTPKAPRP